MCADGDAFSLGGEGRKVGIQEETVRKTCYVVPVNANSNPLALGGEEETVTKREQKPDNEREKPA